MRKSSDSGLERSNRSCAVSAATAVGASLIMFVGTAAVTAHAAGEPAPH